MKDLSTKDLIYMVLITVVSVFYYLQGSESLKLLE